MPTKDPVSVVALNGNGATNPRIHVDMLAYQIAGSGIGLVFLHAYPLSRAMWKGEIEYFSCTAKVIAPDLPGFGKSGRQDKPTISGMARAVKDLLESLSIREPVVLCGLSMGGYVAFEFIRQFPQHVAGLGLFSTRAHSDTPVFRKGRLQSAKKIRRDGLNALPETVLPKLLGQTAFQEKLAVKHEVSQMIVENDKEGVADSLLAMAERRDSTGLLHSIDCPVLVIAGSEDTFIPIDETRSMTEQLSDARLEVISDAGHLVNLEQPARFQEVLKNFLDEVGP